MCMQHLCRTEIKKAFWFRQTWVNKPLMSVHNKSCLTGTTQYHLIILCSMRLGCTDLISSPLLVVSIHPSLMTSGWQGIITSQIFIISEQWWWRRKKKNHLCLIIQEGSRHVTSKTDSADCQATSKQTTERAYDTTSLNKKTTHGFCSFWSSICPSACFLPDSLSGGGAAAQLTWKLRLPDDHAYGLKPIT